MAFSKDELYKNILALADKKLRFAAGDSITAEEIERAERELFDWAGSLLSAGELVPLEYLLQMAGCGRLQRHCVVLALARELDGDIAARFALLNGSADMDYVTPKLLLAAWHIECGTDELLEALDAEASFMRVFFEKNDDRTSWELSPLILNRRAYMFIMGRMEADSQTRSAVTVGAVEPALPPLTSGQPDVAALFGDGKMLVSLYGDEGVGKHFTARHAASRLGRPIGVIKAARLRGNADKIAEAVLRECLMFFAIPVIELSEHEPCDELMALLFDYFDAVITISETRPADYTAEGISQLAIQVGDLTLTEKREVWRHESEAYVLEAAVCPEDMANIYELTYGRIKRALELAQKHSARLGLTAIDKECLRLGCRELFERGNTGKAILVPSAYSWDDLVLPEAQKDAMRHACGQLRYKHMVYEQWGFDKKMPYGRGITMIFSGSPGTGKTMAAQIFARELGLPLYKVELSAVVSKFVGETEKNLDEIFSFASKSRVALLFDEADVLFSKRTEVRDSNDKYSNMEAAYLLQKMESYEGVTILATNFIQNFDEAFKRRVKFIIDFPYPDAPQRLELWQRAFPDNAPLVDVDFAFLAARFELSGSNIRNISLHAAFLAAENETSIGMAEIIPAIQNEYAKSGIILSRADVGEYLMLLPEKR